jgi:hypothetical protein
MNKIFYDIIPPEGYNGKILKKRKSFDFRLSLRIIKSSIVKIVALLMIVCLNWSGLSAVTGTIAYFQDDSGSNGNIFSSLTLGFYLESPADFSPVNINPCLPATRNISLINNGILGFQYTAGVSEISGELCDYLDLTADLDEGDVEYNGGLAGFSYGPIEFSDPEDWVFTLHLNSNELSLQNKTCQFKFVFDGWQIDFSVPGSGFSDREEIVNNINTGDWLPEVEVIYPNGGEVWYMVPPHLARPGLGTYEILWEATSPVYEPEELTIDIWFCEQSGDNCFYQIADDTENDGSYWWTIPYESQFIGSDVRIKIIATDPCGFSDDDMSDADFCPPMLTEEEVLVMLALMSTPENNEVTIEENGTENVSPPESTTTEATTSEDLAAEDNTEETSTTTEETSVISEGDSVVEENSMTTEKTVENQEEGEIIEQIDEKIDEVVDEIVEEVVSDESAESANEDIPMIEGTTIIGMASPNNEVVTEDSESAIEEQPAALPSNEPDVANPDTPDNGGDGSSDDGAGGSGGSGDSEESTNE